MEKDTSNASRPGYVSWVTFLTFLDTLRADGVPTHVDAGVLRNMSGTAQSQLKLTLLFLGLTDKNGQTKDDLKKLAEADNEERKSILREILVRSYDSIFRPTDEFNLESSTAGKFSEKFNIYTGDTKARAEAFFLSAAKYAGINVSKYITQNRATRKKRPVAKIKLSTPQDSSKKLAGDDETRGASSTSGREVDDQPKDDRYNLLHTLQEQQLPKSGVWTAAQRKQYMAAYTSILDLLIQTMDNDGYEAGDYEDGDEFQ